MALRAVELGCGTDAKQLEDRAAGHTFDDREQRCQDRLSVRSTMSTLHTCPTQEFMALG